MSTTTTVSFTADAGKFTLAGSPSAGSRSFGPPAEVATADFKHREPVAWAAATEFLVNGVTSGNVTITAA